MEHAIPAPSWWGRRYSAHSRFPCPLAIHVSVSYSTSFLNILVSFLTSVILLFAPFLLLNPARVTSCRSSIAFAISSLTGYLQFQS